MATSTGQRVGIWIIAGAMIIGTVAGFMAMILTPQNEAKDQERTQVAYETYQKDTEEYNTKTAAQQATIDKRADTLSAKYKAAFLPLSKKVAKFDGDSVKELNVETIKKGNGATIGDDTSYVAYYLGFNPEGTVFDGSIADDKKSLKSPLIVRPNGVIEGWSEAMSGKKLGGIYKLIIPSDKAYGDQEKSEDIGANTPLTFYVMPIETVKTIKQAEIPKELLEAYGG